MPMINRLVLALLLTAGLPGLPALAAQPAARADIIELLPPPPSADSPEQQADLQAVLEAQRSARAQGTTAHAVADSQESCGRFSDALGADLTSSSNSKLLAFLDRTAGKGALISVPAKKYWKRTRPYAFSAEVEPLGDVSPQATSIPEIDTGGKPNPDKQKAADELAHSSYPSGHATFGTICVILLADMVPEKRTALFARNRDYEHSRMVLGAHFPSDLEAGRIAGTLASQRLLQNPTFRRDLRRAQLGLRAELGLPPEYQE
ncbi:MAG TPA: phosphatase PAP2 family protein [Steroidobacteraceae bacterium]